EQRPSGRLSSRGMPVISVLANNSQQGREVNGNDDHVKRLKGGRRTLCPGARGVSAPTAASATHFQYRNWRHFCPGLVEVQAGILGQEARSNPAPPLGMLPQPRSPSVKPFYSSGPPAPRASITRIVFHLPVRNRR